MSNLTPERVRLGERYEELKMLRSGVESMLCDVQKFVRPTTTEFTTTQRGMSGSAQEDGSKNIYDDTAVWANQMFGNGLSSYLVPKADRWAYLKPVGIPSADLSEEELVFLERLSNRVMFEYATPQSQFYPTSHEAFQDIGSFGTAAVYVNQNKGVINFKSCPLADTFFDVNEEGEVDTTYYRRYLSTKAMIQQFPHIVNIQGFDANATNQKWELVYSVEPSDDVRATKKGTVGTTRPFKVTYWAAELTETLQVGGLTYFPFLVPRWAKIAGETYGRSPAMTCLSHIRVLNKMVKELLKSAELSNAPPLVAEDDSLMLPIQYGSRKILFHEPGTPAPTALLSGSQPNLTLEMVQNYRDQIVKSFFVDQIIKEQKKERQSIVEVQDDRGQMLQQLGPLLARMENEYLDPAIDLTIGFLQRKRDPVFENAPASLAGQSLEIIYTSPAAQAQYASDIGNIAGFMQDIAPLAAQKPELMDNVNDTNLIDEYARRRNVPRSVVRSKKEVAAIREQRAEQENQQQAVAAAPELAGAMKDVASAKASDPEGIGQLLNI